jgi:hypothetical protein
VAAHEATSQRESKRVRRKGTHRWKALRIWKATALARRVWKGSWVPWRSEGESQRCKAVRQGASVAGPFGLCSADNAVHRFTPLRGAALNGVLGW